MSGLSPIHTSYLEDTTTVCQHFTCFEFTTTTNDFCEKINKNIKYNSFEEERKKSELQAQEISETFCT